MVPPTVRPTVHDAVPDVLPVGVRTAVIAGGGSAGHVEPALAIADALTATAPPWRVLLLGTAAGLETTLVPARGHRLATIPRVPLPRTISPALLRLPGRLFGAVRAAGAALDHEAADVVVGVGGYVCVPAYLAARRRRIPIVVHEANAKAGVANRLGARLTQWVAVAHLDSGLRGGVLVGIPLRAAITTLDRDAARPGARAAFGLPPTGPVLLVTGGSQGARRINEAVVGAAGALAAAGIAVLHHAGRAHADAVRAAVADYPNHHVIDYIDSMEAAYAAADLAVCRAGAMTCAELAAVGLPAVYVPLPIGNGEQRLNAAPTVAAGGGLLIDDGAFTPAWVVAHVVALVGDPPRLAAMGAAAKSASPADPAAAMVSMVTAASDMAADGRSARMKR